MHRISRLVVLSSLLASLAAQSVPVPNANATTRGTTQLNSLVRNSGNPRTYMLGVNASELSGIPIGSVINGISFRFQVFASNSASWPASDITWSDYQIFVGAAIPTTTWTGNFMANFSGTPVQVRSGPMVLTAGTYTNSNPVAPAANAWGEFYFDFQVPYTYTGGDLGLLFSHPGSNDPTTAQYLDAVANNAATYGVSFSQSIYPVGNAGLASSLCISRIHYGYGKGCPGTANLVPNLVQNQNTTGGLGGTILIAIGNAPPSAPAAFVVGTGTAPLPLPNGCTLWNVPLVVLPTTLNMYGRAQLGIPVPPGLIGGVSAQAIVIDAGGPMGYTSSNGVQPTAQ